MSFLDNLDKVRQTGPDKWVACCPIHGDKNPSMRIKLMPSGSYTITCFACGANGLDVFNHFGLPLDELFGKPLHEEATKRPVTRKMTEDYYTDKIIVEIHETDKEAGKRISLSDYKRYKLAKARMTGYEIKAGIKQKTDFNTNYQHLKPHS